jgi:hypothetical protein
MQVLRVMLVAALAAGCSKQVAFQGAGPISVAAMPKVAEAKPADAPPRVEVRDNKIEIHEKVQLMLLREHPSRSAR